MTIRTRLSLALFALTSLLASSADAQNVRQLPRATAVTGVNDSALVTVSDSAGTAAAPRLRAVSTHELFKRPVGSATRPSFSFATDSTTGFYRATSGATGMSVAVNGTGYWVWQSNGTFAPRNNNTVDLGTTNDWVRRLYADRTLMNNGSASGPTYTFDDDQDLGVYRRGADTLAFAIGGVDTTLFMTFNDVSNQNVGGLTFRTKASRYYHFFSGTSQGPSFVDGQIRTSTGNESTPTYSYRDGINSGMWLKDASASDTLVFSANGTRSLAITNSSTAGGKIFGGTQSLELHGGTGTSTNIVMRTTTSGGSVTDALSINDAQQLATQWGTAALPRYTFISDLNTGMFRNGADQLGFSTAGLTGMRINELQSTLIDTGTAIGTARRGLGFLGDSSKGISWSPGNSTMYFVVGSQAGDVVQMRDAGTNAVQLYAGGGSASRTSPSFTWGNFGSSGMGHTPAGDTVTMITGGTVRMLIADMAATAVGDVALCLSTGDVVRKGATCGSSSSKVKTDIRSLDPAASVNAVMKLRPVRYAYKKGFYNERAEFGLIAEEAAAVDQRLAFYAEREDKANGIAKGEAINVNDRAVLSLLISTVQAQQKKLEALCKAGITPAC